MLTFENLQKALESIKATEDYSLENIYLNPSVREKLIAELESLKTTVPLPTPGKLTLYGMQVIEDEDIPNSEVIVCGSFAYQMYKARRAMGMSHDEAVAPWKKVERPISDAVEKIIKTEQSSDGRMILVETNQKSTFTFEKKSVLSFIIYNRLNVTDTYGGNNGSGEPWNDLPSIPDIQEPAEYLDENWDKVIEQFWKWKFNIS